MQKVLSGMLYRFIRSIESWALVLLLLASSLFFCYSSLDSFDFISVKRNDFTIHAVWYEGMNLDIDKNNIDLHRFDALGVDAGEAYRAMSERISPETLGRLTGTFNYTGEEIDALYTFLSRSKIIPLILIIIFIPVFFGRMFSDGTVKNLVACGHSRTRIYLASLILTVIIDIIMMAVMWSFYAVFCLYFGWHPPIYLPVLIPLSLLNLLILICLSAICLALLFMSGKKTTSFIAGFVLLVMLYFLPAGTIFVNLLQYSNTGTGFNTDSEDFRIFIEAQSEGDLDKKVFDLSTCDYRYYYEGRELNIYGEKEPKPIVNSILLGIIYLDPFLINDLQYTYTSLDPYSEVRDNAATVNILNNIFWISVFTASGIIVFNKKEIR